MILELSAIYTAEELEKELSKQGMRRLTSADPFSAMLNSVRVFWSDIH